MTPEEFAGLRAFLKARSGLNLAAEKLYLVESRLAPLVAAHGYGTLGRLAAAMERAEAAVQTAVIEAMTTNESSFFRDKAPFERLGDTILPDLIKRRAGERRLSFWCAAASTGQEPYSIAMSLLDGGLPAGWKADILGTDLSSEVVRRASEGLFTQFEVQRGLPVKSLVKHFRQEGEAWRISAAARAMCRFKVFNLLQSYAGLGTFDVVFCRNVLIYFDQATKTDVLSRIAKAMKPDGWLVLGSAETAIGLVDALEPVKGLHGIYRPAPRQAGAPARPAAAVAARS